MGSVVRIALVGDFNPEYRSHHATNAALEHAGARLAIRVKYDWIPTTEVERDGHQVLRAFDGLWATAGSPYRSMEGMLCAIEFARTRMWPFVATRGGFQHTLLEYARNVLQIADADSAEHQSGSKNLVIRPVSCALPGRAVGAPKLSGGGKLRIQPGTLLAGIYQQSEIEEEYFCNYEVNPAYLDRLQAAGLRVSAWGEDRAIRAIELPDHDFFLATLFQPQLCSSAETPHPVVLAFLRATAAFRNGRMDCFEEREASSMQA